MGGMLAGKNILVTGSAGGIGRASALLFAAEGAKVGVADLNREGADETVRLVEAAGGTAIALACDLSQAGAADRAVADVVEAFGRLDGAFNNAGITGGQVGQGGKLTAEWEEDAFDRIMSVNTKATWYCLRAALKQMALQESGGSIVNTASLAGLTGFQTNSGYTASKHAVVGMTKVAALEYAPKIRVNALCPGYVDTDMLKDTMSRRGDAILAKIPFGRLAAPDEMAQMVCWLLSDRASYATGGAFVVDGGYMAG